MSFEHKENSGTLFPNSFKVEGDKKPDYKGEANINGKIMEVALWKKQTAKGGIMLSLSFQEPWKKPEQQAPQQQSEDPTLPF